MSARDHSRGIDQTSIREAVLSEIAPISQSELTCHPLVGIVRGVRSD